MGAILPGTSQLFFKNPVFLEFSYSLNVTNNLTIFREQRERKMGQVDLFC